MVSPRSLGLWTEIELARTRAEVIDRGDYVAIRTPADPTYYFGNLLVLPAPILPGALPHWLERFATDVGRPPQHQHVTLRWDTTTGDVGARSELEGAGFRVEVDQVMLARAVVGPATIPGLTLRALTADELPLTAALAFAISDDHSELHRTLLARRAAWQADLVRAGRAVFRAAFDGTTLVASLGIVNLWRFARYQDVQVAAAYRQRGIASALLAAAARDMEATGATAMLIVAEPRSAAAMVYARAGFDVAELTGSASRARS